MTTFAEEQRQKKVVRAKQLAEALRADLFTAAEYPPPTATTALVLRGFEARVALIAELLESGVKS